MITSESKLKRVCKDFRDIENYEEAVKSPEQYDLHHRKEIETLDDGTVVLRSMKDLKDLDLYYHRPAEELIFLSHSEHMSMHHKGKKNSAETRAKMSEANKGRFAGDKHPRWKGDQVTDKTKRRRLREQRRREASSIC